MEANRIISISNSGSISEEEPSAAANSFEAEQDPFVCGFDNHGHLLFVNDHCCHYFGKKPDEIIGAPYIPFFHEADRKKSETIFSKLRRSKPVVVEAYRAILPNGEIRWQHWTQRAIFNTAGNLVAFRAHGRNLTDEELADHGRGLLLNQYKVIVENVHDGIIVCFEENPAIYANCKAVEITGYSIFELLQLSPEKLYHPDEYPKIKERMLCLMTGEVTLDCCETLVVRKDGTVLPVEISFSKIDWENQPAALISFRDISQRKHVEAELGRIQKALEHHIRIRSQELLEITSKLEQKQTELLWHKKDLEKANKELIQTNTALTVLARNIDRKRDEVERKVTRSITSQILPLADEIMRDNLPEIIKAKMEVLITYLNNLTSPGASRSRDVIASLSPMELRVATMIKNGFTSEDIARLLHISSHTVKTHRRSIRSKLRIRNASINLTSYLKNKLGNAASTL